MFPYRWSPVSIQGHTLQTRQWTFRWKKDETERERERKRQEREREKREREKREREEREREERERGKGRKEKRMMTVSIDCVFSFWSLLSQTRGPCQESLEHISHLSFSLTSGHWNRTSSRIELEKRSQYNHSELHFSLPELCPKFLIQNKWKCWRMEKCKKRKVRKNSERKKVKNILFTWTLASVKSVFWAISSRV